MECTQTDILPRSSDHSEAYVTDGSGSDSKIAENLDQTLRSAKVTKGAKCIVPDCEQQYGAKRSVTLHTFPVDDTRKKEWLKGLGISIAPDLLTDKFRVCGFHFNSNDYKTTTTRPLLKKQAVPSRCNQRPTDRKLESVPVKAVPVSVRHESRPYRRIRSKPSTTDEIIQVCCKLFCH
jgi:hypothetical protein